MFLVCIGGTNWKWFIYRNTPPRMYLYPSNTPRAGAISGLFTKIATVVILNLNSIRVTVDKKHKKKFVKSLLQHHLHLFHHFQSTQKLWDHFLWTLKFKKMRSFPSFEDSHRVVHAFIFSCLDFCTGLYTCSQCCWLNYRNPKSGLPACIGFRFIFTLIFNF